MSLGGTELFSSRIRSYPFTLIVYLPPVGCYDEFGCQKELRQHMQFLVVYDRDFGRVCRNEDKVTLAQARPFVEHEQQLIHLFEDIGREPHALEPLQEARISCVL